MANDSRDYAQVIKAAFDPATNAMKSSPIAALVTSAYDSIGVTYTSVTIEEYAYYLGGLSGTLVSTVTVTYTDSTKNQLLSIVAV